MEKCTAAAAITSIASRLGQLPLAFETLHTPPEVQPRTDTMATLACSASLPSCTTISSSSTLRLRRQVHRRWGVAGPQRQAALLACRGKAQAFKWLPCAADHGTLHLGIAGRQPAGLPGLRRPLPAVVAAAARVWLLPGASLSPQHRCTRLPLTPRNHRKHQPRRNLPPPAFPPAGRWQLRRPLPPPRPRPPPPPPQLPPPPLLPPHPRPLRRPAAARAPAWAAATTAAATRWPSRLSGGPAWRR